MDIGEEQEPYVIEPVEEPVPGVEREKRPEPDRERPPVKEPVPA